MSRTAVMGLFVCIVAGLSGCASPARVIRQDPTSVVVAIPDNTNNWPFYYQDEAKHAAGGYIQDPVLVSTQRMKVGEQTTNASDTTRRELSDKQRSFGEVITSTDTKSTVDRYEYQLEFRSVSPARTTNPPPSPGGPAASLSPIAADVVKPPAIPPILPVTPPVSPATNMPSTALPGPGR